MLQKIRNIFFKNQQRGFIGAAMLVNVMIACVIMGMMASSVAIVQSSYFSSLNAGRAELEAQQWAEIKADVVKLTGYDNIVDQSRKVIDGSTEWEDEVQVGAEQTISADNKQKIVTVNIYKTGDSAARFSLKVPLSTQGSGNSGVPIGTVIIWSTWANPDVNSGVWLDCNGQWVNPTLYPKLAVLMSNVPNYQGVFLRGFGSVVSGHYGWIEHWSAGLGELQGDSIRNAYGTFEAASTNGQGLSGIFTSTGSYGTSTFSGNNRGEIIALNFSNGFPISNEIRPINKAVRYLIKAA